MSQLANLKNEIPKWTLESDRQLFKSIKSSTDQMYTGIQDMITQLRELEQNTEDCYIQLRHAVNWVSSLSYVKFIENNIQPSNSDGVVEQKPTPTVIVAKTPEQIIAKHRKAMEIAINDLGIKDLKPDEAVTQVDEAMEGQTMAMGGNFVTPQLRKKLPFLIGSKEFYSSAYIGIEVGAAGGLTEESLKKLQDESKPADNSSPKNQDKPADLLANQGASIALANAASGIEEAKSRESVSSKQGMNPSPKKFDASSYLDQYTSSKSSKPFDIEGAEDEVLPMFDKNKSEDKPVLPPAGIDVPLPPPDMEVPVPPNMDIPLPPPDIQVPVPPNMDIPLPPPDLSVPLPPPDISVPVPPNIEVALPPDDNMPKLPQLPSAQPAKKPSLFGGEDDDDVFSSIRNKSIAKAEAPKKNIDDQLTKLLSVGSDKEKKKDTKVPDVLSIYMNKSQTSSLFEDKEDESKKKPEVSKEKKEEISKRLSNFLDDDEGDGGFGSKGAKALPAKKNLFGDD